MGLPNQGGFVENRKALEELRNILEKLTQDAVDDPEEILTDIAGDASYFIEALDEVLESGRV